MLGGRFNLCLFGFTDGGYPRIGHLPGLAHSQVIDANMYAYTSEGQVKPLTQDDIDGIRAKYST